MYNNRLQYILDDKIIVSNKMNWITYVKIEKLMKQDIEEALMLGLKMMFDGTILTSDVIDMLPISHIDILINNLSDIYIEINKEIIELNKDEDSKKKMRITMKEILED